MTDPNIPMHKKINKKKINDLAFGVNQKLKKSNSFMGNPTNKKINLNHL
jgi:hypothetical protein